MSLYENVKQFDPEIYDALMKEANRQEEHIELIASENFVSPAVLEAVGSTLTNKYAEGYPSKRYYGGCEFVDVAEQLAIDRAKKLLNLIENAMGKNVSDRGSEDTIEQFGKSLI